MFLTFWRNHVPSIGTEVSRTDKTNTLFQHEVDNEENLESLSVAQCYPFLKMAFDEMEIDGEWGIDSRELMLEEGIKEKLMDRDVMDELEKKVKKVSIKKMVKCE